MKAVVITSYGGVEGIGVQEVETPPAPTANRVRVQVHAAGLNRADILQRRGHYPAPPGYPTNIPGLEFAGEVESVGQEVRTWKIRDRVFGITGGGAQAEFVVVPESNLARIPAELDWVQAGAMPEVFITAHDALFTRANLQLGERALIHAAASGVGTAAIQVAHAVGAMVIGTMLRGRSIEEKAEATRRFASSVLPLVSRGAIRPIIDRVYPANEIRDAHARMESNASFGKIVLTFG